MKSKRTKKSLIIFSGVTLALLALITAADCVAFGPYYGVLKNVLGGEHYLYDETSGNKIERQFESKAEALANANQVTEEICEEGMVLLKNDACLPLAQGKKVSVFGKNSVNLVYNGTGSSDGDTSSAKTIYQSLTDAGFVYNDTLKAFYDDTTKSGSGRGDITFDMNGQKETNVITGETPYSSYTEEVKASYSQFSDAAIIVLSRVSGEGADLPMTSANGRHYLEVDPDEEEMIKNVTGAGFAKVILVINSANAMELGFVEDGSLGKIDACINLSRPGNEGVMALGKILNGTVTPSGHLVDTYLKDFTLDPSWNNFAQQNKYSNADYYFAQYAEGIYVGYKYYETKASQELETNNSTTWYDNTVLYPFGYGLSYTDFSWEMVSSDFPASGIEKDKTYTVKVKVTNTGDYPGKEVVQMYAIPPYTKGGIEKAYKNLVSFAKTETLYPKSQSNGSDKPNSQEITLTFNPYDLASYDYDDANNNGFTGYELDGGTYRLALGSNAHQETLHVDFSVAQSGITYPTDPTTGKEVKNLFTDSTLGMSNVLSRKETLTQPKAAEESQLTANDAILAALKDTGNNNTKVKNGEYSQMPLTNQEVTVTLDALAGKSYDDPLWDTMMNQLTVDEMASLFNNANFCTEAILRIGKNETIESDGPTGFVNFMSVGDPKIYDCCNYCSEVLVASTFNVDLANKLGDAMAEEGLQGYAKDGTPYTAIYAPGANIHRSPFGGRNGEYYSEDSFLSGKMAANQIKGARNKGLNTYIKHFAVNEQETYRMANGLINWLDEQTLREIYLKPFEMAVKEGGTQGVMSSFTRIGTRWCGGDYRLLTEVLRDEWGFRGAVISDFNTNSYMNCKTMAYAGGNLNLSTTPDRKWKSFKDTSAEDVNVLRENAKGVLYAVANSNALQAKVIGSTLPTWVVVTIVVESVVMVADLAWGVLLIVFAHKKQKE